jgi:hypothetical protein
MKIQRLRNNDIMIILPSRQLSRWRLIVHAALDWFYTVNKPTYIEKMIIKDLETLKTELNQ